MDNEIASSVILLLPLPHRMNP